MHSLLNNIRTRKPLVHCITNYVTANDCANLLLAGGAVPVMADAPEDAAEITSAAQALVLNLGTLSRSRLQAMLLAGKAANVCGIPVVLDPVGVWATAFRREAAGQLVREVQFAAVRGNLQEIAALGGGTSDPARTIAVQMHTKVICTGAEDIVTDGETVFRCRNGHPILRQITGAGCMLSALTGAFLAAENSVESCAAAVCAMGLAGELAASRMTPRDGNASCRTYLIDAVYNMTDEQLEEGAKLEHLT